ncbi:hypothetical protein [Treponema sp.]|uniref:hypothetical protein n=1 Tax=Treponema sp. TaxID=166 RepID=UPI003FD75198
MTDNKQAGFCSFVGQLEEESTLADNVYENIFDQYEKVVVQALITSFGLDFLAHDQHGGAVDTVHNVREIGRDPNMTYKNQVNASDYNNRGEYDSAKYHAGENFQRIKHNARENWRNNGNQPLHDEYTDETNLGFYGHSKNASADKNAELDHIVEAKAIHDDPGRVLANLDGAKLADSEENFAWTNKSLNASMGSWANQQMNQWEKDCKTATNAGKPLPPKPHVDMEAYIDAHPELDENTKKNMREHYKKAKTAYDAKVNLAYYTSKKFWKDTGVATAKAGLSMGLRQALGLVFTEIWFSVKDAIIKCRKTGEALFKAIAKAIKQGLNNAKKKFHEIWEKFIEGAVAGVLSSLVTTLANIFVTTAKNTVKIIRETWASLTQACKIIFINPDEYPLGERFVAGAKVIATGASVVAGSMVKELLNQSPIGKITILSDIIPTFCSVLVTGIMSCSLLYILDHNKGIRKAVEMLNKLPDVDNFNHSLKKQAELLDRYLAEFEKLDFATLEKQQVAFSLAAKQLSIAQSPMETNNCLRNIYSDLNMQLPWNGYQNLDSFISDRHATLVFQ